MGTFATFDSDPMTAVGIFATVNSVPMTDRVITWP
jgi:hypothetical protein